MRVGHVAALARYPVKSMVGEWLEQVHVTERGVAGDRCWAAYTLDGGIGSGKTTRRFRRVAGLLDLRARLEAGVGPVAGDAATPLVTFPDGHEHRADAPAASTALSALLGQPLRLARETSVPHHDESPVHVVTTAAMQRLEEIAGEPVDAARFRANVVLAVDTVGFVEDDWHGRHLALGEQVVLRLGPGMPRCVMVDMPQPHDGLRHHSRLLRALGQVHDVEFGLQAHVVRTGTLRRGDCAVLLQPEPAPRRSRPGGEGG